MKKKILFFLFSFLISLGSWAQTSSIQVKESVVQDWNVKQVLKVEINSSINPATYNYLKVAFQKVKKEGHQLLLITMNTPGGLVSTTKQILTLFGKDDVPVVIWIAPGGASATSAGAIISSGAHVLFMAEGTSIGAATPIEMSGDIKAKDARKKAINSLVSLVESLSDARGRNQEMYAKMVKEAASFNATDAQEKNIIDGVVNSLPELIKALQGRKINLKGHAYTLNVQSPTITSLSMDLGQKLLDTLANPSMAYVLFLIGAALLYLELQSPGGFIAGGIGAVCLLLAGIGFQILPLNFGALGLILLAFVLFLLEAYIISYGMLTLAGLIALTAGSLFLYRTDEVYLQMSTALIFSTVASIGIFVLFLGYYLAKDWKNRKTGEISDYNSPIGKQGHIIEVLPSEEEGIFYYQIKVGGEFWKAKSNKHLQINDQCEIKKQEQLILTIE